MAEPFLAEIRVFSFNFPPKGWALANGQLLPINQNAALFALLGTNYGGNGQTNFALPNLQGRVPIHMSGSDFQLGDSGGEITHTLTMNQMPMHMHFAQATSATANSTKPVSGAMLGMSSPGTSLNYGPPENMVAMASNALSTVGGGQAHENRQPYLVLNFCIALQGIFPSQN